MAKKKAKGYNDFTEDTRYTTPITKPNSSAVHITRSSPPNPSNRKRQQPTHFLALPLVNPQNRARLASALDAFREDVVGAAVSPETVRPVGSLHLTLGVMQLPTEEDVRGVVGFLESVDLGMLRGLEFPRGEGEGEAVDNPLSITLAGLVPMQTPTRTSVLYAEPREETGRLLPFCAALREQFVKAGLLLDEGRELKLHVTVANTIYAKPKNTRGRRSGAEREAQPSADDTQSHANGKGGEKTARGWRYFDASGLIEKYRDFIWAEDVGIETIQICKMGVGKDGVYRAVAERRI